MASLSTMIASRAIALWATTMLAGCLQGGPYACEEEGQCRRPGSAGGTCEQGWCAYEDESCDSKLRFSDNAGDGLAGACVGAMATTGAMEGTGETSSSSSGAGGCSVPCNSPPGPCYASTGTCDDATCVYAPRAADVECDDEDPCSASSVCDGEGSCIADVPVACNDPPSDCYLPTGSCDPMDGMCMYDFADAGTSCEDGDVCTEDDTCDDSGSCQSGPSCPTDNPCETGSCVGEECMYTPVPDGMSCGLVPSARCCSGACVDISTDANHCGACGAPCLDGHSCQSVAVTSGCELAPADTSGRCGCDGENADCLPGYVCRTQAPYTNLCTPEDPGACPSMFVEVNFCPNYCFY